MRRLAVLAAVPLLLGAAAFESAPSFTAAQLLPAAQVKGPNHSVTGVATEGYFHVFEITTPLGKLEAEGTSQVSTRVREADALAELQKVSKSEVFLQSAGGAVLNVGKGVSAAVADPGATAKGIGKGVARMGTNLGRKAKRTADDATKKEEPAEGGAADAADATTEAAVSVANSALGVSKSSRKWAQKVGADPYTTNPILKKALGDIGKIDAAGGIAAKVVVPIPPVVSTTASVGNLVWSKDPEALLKENEAALKAIGVSGEAIGRLYRANGLTLTTYTRLAQALSGLNLPGVADYVDTASHGRSEREAHFFVESAEMLKKLHAATPAAAVLMDSRLLVAKKADGTAVALAPVDYVGWTDAFAKTATETAARAKAELGATKLELRITGKASATAKKEAQALGWTVVESAR
jgi:hypothetical protein